MVQNVAITAGSGTTIAADLITGDASLGTADVQYMKIMDGTIGGTTKAAVGANGLKVDGSGATQPVSGTFWQATQPVSGTFWQATQPVSIATNTPDVTDRAARLLGVVDKGKIWDGTNIAAVKAGVIAVTADNPLVVTVHPSSAPMTTQPVSGTFWQATQPVSGTFWQTTQPVSIATMPSTPVTGTFWQATQPVSGTFWQATQPVSVAANLPVIGEVASGATDANAPQKIGGQARITNPTAVTDGQRVNAIFDKLGKQIVVGAVRDLKAKQVTTITTTTETTIVTAGATGVFNDVYGLVITNTSATAVNVAIKEATAGTTVMNIAVPANDTRGLMLPVDSAMVQTTAASNWTATLSGAVTSIIINALYVKNI